MKNTCKNTCIVCEYGWIIVGIKAGEESKSEISLENAFVVRKWYNGKGIGGIAKKENKNEYTLDEIGNVDINKSKILFEIPCEW
jgi:hypothetical protein